MIEAKSFRNEIDSYVEAFERARASGPVPNLRAFAPPVGHELHLLVLHELLRVDLEFGWAQGQPTPLADYRAHYPDVFAEPESGRAIVFEEYRLRRQAGETPDLDEYRLTGVSVCDWPSMPSQECAGPEAVMSQRHSATATFDYLRSRRSDSQAHAPSPHVALFRAVYHKDHLTTERLAKAVRSWPEIGDLFCGFRLIGELGRGAFGRVYLARQGDLADRPVALKVVCDIHGEPQRLARLQHTHVVPVYSAHAAPPFQAICMPYFGGVTLDEVIKILHDHSIPPKSASVVTEILRANARPEAALEMDSEALGKFSNMRY